MAHGRTVAVVGLGDIGRNTVTRMQAHGLNVIAYDPGVEGDAGIPGLQRAVWPERTGEADFIVFTCALNSKNFHMLNGEVFAGLKDGVRIVNVARGPLIDEAALIAALQSGKVHSAALDVFEIEPLPADSPLRAMDRCIFGTHNGSNTVDGVIRATQQAITSLSGFF